MRYLKKLLLGCFIALGVFTAAVLALCVLGAAVPDSLIYCFFGAFGAEIILSAIIKITETKEGVQNGNQIHDQKQNLQAEDHAGGAVCDCALHGDERSADEGQAVG